MKNKTSPGGFPIDLLSFLAAVIFVSGIMFAATSLMIGALLLLLLRGSLHLVSLARPVPQHFRKNRAAVRYSR